MTIKDQVRTNSRITFDRLLKLLKASDTVHESVAGIEIGLFLPSRRVASLGALTKHFIEALRVSVRTLGLPPLPGPTELSLPEPDLPSLPDLTTNA